MYVQSKFVVLILQAGLCNVADRVNVGLIPSSEEGWPSACAALKHSTGGWLHIHGNVDTKPAGGSDEGHICDLSARYSNLLSTTKHANAAVVKWIHYVTEQVSLLLPQRDTGSWSVEVKHVEHVKSYAPHISHFVLDLECRPQ